MRAGKLDRRITIEQVSRVADGFGGAQTETWSTFVTVWAAVASMTASERFTSDQKYSSNVKTFTVRYVAGILPTMRILYESAYYRILGIRELEMFGRKRGFEITAEAMS